MPKSTKVVPPQQASLQEIWGKKNTGNTKIEPKLEPKLEPKIESEAMEIDPLQAQTSMINTTSMLRGL